MQRAESGERSVRCSYCSRSLWGGYRWTCHVCGATYCYIHLRRHPGHTKIHPLAP